MKLKKEENVKRGKRAKTKGNNYERIIAKLFGERYNVKLERTPQSGGFAKKTDRSDDYRGDITIVDNKNMLLLHIECKNQKQWQLRQWLKQAEEDCPDGRIPVVVFHQHNTSKDYVCLSLDDFLELVPKPRVIQRRVFK